MVFVLQRAGNLRQLEMASSLARLPLEALAGPDSPRQAEGGLLPAALSRTTVQLCFVSRSDTIKLQDVELELQRAWRALPSSRKGTLPAATADSSAEGGTPGC